ncbi:MAG: arginine--tRNA ligase, partial [Verrucomicrobia bacterium]|nr:arginine--tRNA ligase [Verrucomicrobiota bacterium]
DFSSPNVAKPMHVGHIRSTILGDSLARVFRLLGHRVVTDNHIGDWGTQFGKLLVGWKRLLDPDRLEADPMAELERLYRLVNEACEKDEKLLEEARSELVKLQRGDPENRAIWERMIALSLREFDKIYQRLDVRFDHVLGESFYNDRLQALVEELLRKGIARESEGAVAVFFEDDPELKNRPAIIRKRDGAANYATTDLATLAYRVETWNPDEIIYVTDARQQLHFQQIFAIFRKWRPEAKVRLAHVWFGSILGEDGRPFKTRSGDTVKLADLLDEAEERAFRLVTEKNPSLPEEERRRIARIVGIGAVKYADLLPNRQTDYVFSWEKMLALNGNTAPYLLYAYARIRSIFRRLADQGGRFDPAEAAARFAFTDPRELALAKQLLNFSLALEAVAEEYRPNYLCNYLYELAGKFTEFYENCPVLKADEPVRSARLLLADITARTFQTGLGALGIQTAERM